MALAPAADVTGPRAPVIRVGFVAGAVGDWRINEMRPMCGDGLPAAAAFTRVEGSSFATGPETGSGWVLHGVRSNERYIECDEFAEADAGAFEELVGLLRETEEWRYVAREDQISLRRACSEP